MAKMYIEPFEKSKAFRRGFDLADAFGQNI
jgi:hypothetical protein